MLGFFPTPYDNEVLFGVFARYHKASGNWILMQTLTDLFGSISNGTISNFPGKLHYLHGELGFDDAFTPKYLLNKHTLLPVYKPFLSDDRIEKMIYESTYGDANKISPLIGEISGNITKNKYAKFCERCFEESKLNLGEYFFNRNHQFPGNEACYIHNIPLKKAYKGGALFKRSIVSISDDDISNEVNYIVSKYFSYFINLSKDIAFFLENDNINLKHKKIHDVYRVKLNDIGMIDKKEAVKHTVLQEKFLDFYPSDFLEYLNCNIDYDNNWLRVLTRKQIKYIHPLRNILFVRFLFGSVEEFVEFYNKTEIVVQKPFGDGPWPCLNPVADHYKNNVINTYRLSKKSKPQRPIGIFECTCGYTYSRVVSSEGNLYREQKLVTTKFGNLWESKYKEFLLVNKYSINKISKIMKCQPITLIRCAVKLGLENYIDFDVTEISKGLKERREQISKLEISYKNDILKYLEENPNTYKSEIKNKLRKQYSWLRYHCKEWLNENVPLKNKDERYRNLKNDRVNWVERDKELAIRVQEVINKIKLRPNFKRITIGLISIEMDRYPIDKQLSKLPITKGIIEENIESLVQSQKRRIKYIYDELSFCGEEIARNIIIKKAGLDIPVAKEIDDFINDLIHG